MLFAIAAFLRDGAEKELIDYHEDLNEFLGPSAAQVQLAGALRDKEGHRIGYLAIFDGTAEQARQWADESPLAKAKLYEHMDLYEFENEIGAFG